jgi:hypothetical protein
MFDLFPISLRRYSVFAFQALTRTADGSRGFPGIRRLAVMGVFVPLFALVQSVHWLGFLLDEIFFRGYRRVEIQAPVFVLGVPRSGTTKLHAVLARDPRYTTFTTWECLFGLSVTARRFWLGLARLDRLVGAPAARAVAWLERRVFSGLDDVHAMSLATPEEDYFALMPILSCFILFLPFPGAQHLWRMGAFDRDMPPRERERILRFYRACLQKHLYVHGSHKRLLSKNAAFAPLAMSLAAQFPDALFIICLREPGKTVPSQLSSIAPGLRFFGVPEHESVIRDRLLQCLAFYYENLDALAESLPEQRRVLLDLSGLAADLAGGIATAYAQLELPLTPEFRQLLKAESAAARAYRSGHSYSLAQFGLDQARLDADFPAARKLARRSAAAKALQPPPIDAAVPPDRGRTGSATPTTQAGGALSC